ncbi:TetR/AcrR family transcriptional regulator [Virgibacillus sp. 179-BFC.A HS]|uniref:TetR/AcrR family transcriptional regulator n=1 Tax=Tigheibacillus jepli TaxID=3035914 RepID=A0ABU5CK01_9BACI|nr:TetR/AcrR family transcriptional regulator [Virgibacillus sp. 179-BFC.A HS]MDY0406565.1 TetR/AcrR family transcriptional regulator [Virgibacillus sp. 179-BFC.A HS]
MTKDKLIQAAIANFAEFGYQGATMSKIAKEVGIKPASIYYFFDNKEALFKEAVKVILAHHFSSMKKTYHLQKEENLHTLFSELLRSILVHHTTFQNETKAYVTMVNSPISNIKREITAYLQRYNQWLVGQLMHTISAKHPELKEEKISSLIDYFIFIGNGLFWGLSFTKKMN